MRRHDDEDVFSGTTLRHAWRHTSPQIRRASAAIFAMGAALCVLGVVGDLRHYWSDKPFLTNLVSGTAGACFGIPVALVFIRFLQDDQTRRLQIAQRTAEAERRARLQIAQQTAEAERRLKTFDAASGELLPVVGWQKLRRGLVDAVSAHSSGEAVRNDKVVSANFTLLRNVQSLDVSPDAMDRANLAFCDAWVALRDALRRPEIGGLPDRIEREHARELDRLAAKLRSPATLDWLRKLVESAQLEKQNANYSYRAPDRETVAMGLGYLEDLSECVSHAQHIRTEAFKAISGMGGI